MKLLKISSIWFDTNFFFDWKFIFSNQILILIEKVPFRKLKIKDLVFILENFNLITNHRHHSLSNDFVRRRFRKKIDLFYIDDDGQRFDLWINHFSFSLRSMFGRNFSPISLSIEFSGLMKIMMLMMIRLEEKIMALSNSTVKAIFEWSDLARFFSTLGMIFFLISRHLVRI